MTTSCMVMLPFEGTMTVPTTSFSSASLSLLKVTDEMDRITFYLSFENLKVGLQVQPLVLVLKSGPLVWSYGSHDL